MTPPKTIQFGQENSFDNPPATLPFGAENSFNSDIQTTTPKSTGFFGPLKDTSSKFINNDSESLTDFASRKASSAIFGIPAPATAEDLDMGAQGTNDSKNWGAFGGFKIPLKTAANVLPDLANTTADVGNFAWQSFAHPVDTIKSIARDPLGFAEGMVGDLVSQPLEGLSTGIKDLITGQGAGKAAANVGAGFQKGMIAFIDRPISSIIQLKLAKGLATDPVGTTKTVVKDSIDLATKPWQMAYKFVKDPKQAVTDVANAVQTKYDAIKNFPTFFTKEGQAKIAQGMGNQIMEYAQNSIKINDLQERLKTLDINSKEHASSLNELNMYKQKAENAQNSISLLTSHFADKTGETFAKGGYGDTSEFVNDTQGVVDGMYKSKDYTTALNPKGQPVNISDVNPLVSYLSEQGAKLEAQGNSDSYAFKSAADELKLRSEISKAGGIDSYVESQARAQVLGEGIDIIKNPGKFNLREETVKQELKDNLMKKIEAKPSFYSRPLTADDLFSYVNNLGDRMKSNFGSKLIADQHTAGSTAKGITMDILGKELGKVDPTAPTKLALENQKFSDLKNIWDKWSEKKFDSTGAMIKFVTSDKNWADFQNFPKEIITKFQNTLASFIVDSSRNPDGSMNFTKLSKLTQEYSPNLTTNHTGALSELSYANSLPDNVHNTPAINLDLKNVLNAKGELTQAEKAMSETEIKAEALKANMDVVGTTPEKIATNLKSIHTVDDLNSFMKAANITDPRVLGDLITGTLYDQMQQQFGEYKGVNFQNLAELVKQVRDIGKSSPLGEQLKKALFSPEKQKALEQLETQSEDLSRMFESQGLTPGMKRLFHTAFGATASLFGWHVTAFRNFYEAVKPAETPKTKVAPNSENLKKMGEKAPKTKEGVVPRVVRKVPKITPAAEGLRNVENQDQE